MKIFTTIRRAVVAAVVCTVFAGTAMAEVADMNIGYCAGQVPSAGSINFKDNDLYVSAAIYIPASMLNTCSGNDLIGVRAAMASKLNIDELVVWVRSDLNGANICESDPINTTTSLRLVKGFNSVPFKTPYAIAENNEAGIYLGYTFHQKGSAFGIANLAEPQKNAFFYKVGDGAWEDHSAEGTLSVEGMVRGENLPMVNATLTSVKMPADLVVERGEVRLLGKVKNIATQNITSFDVVGVLNGVETGSAHVDCDIAFNKTGDFDVRIKHGLTEKVDGTFGVKIANVNGLGDDEDMSDNVVEAPFKAVLRDYAKKIFVEEFTTEACVNCPRVAGFLHELLAEDAYKNDVVAVCHHAGYYTDWLTIPADTEYLWLYNQSGTYAPAIMTDRTVYKDNSPAYCPVSKTEMSDQWNQALLKSSYVSVNIAGEQDAAVDNKIKVTVTGARAIENLCANPQITVYLVEDDILARSQSGGGADYMQQHVTRAVNSTWGAPLKFNGEEYSYECEFALSKTWNTDNMSIVAMIANYNSKNALDCQVLNANSVKFDTFYTKNNSSVEGVEAVEEGAAEYFTVSGIKASDNLTPGIYVKKVGSKASKVVVK